MRPKDFDDYLQEQCTKEGGYEGVLDDDYEVAFERWLEPKEAGDIIQYAEKFFKELTANNK